MAGYESGRGAVLEAWGSKSGKKQNPKDINQFILLSFSTYSYFPLLFHQIFIFKGLMLLYLSFAVWTSEPDLLKKQDLESIIWLN